jgi:hypothetical protein
MRLKTISIEELAMETAKVVGQARKGPVLLRSPGQATLVLRPLVDDDIADELVIANPAFRASIRRARRRRRAGRGIPLLEARRRLVSVTSPFRHE